MNNLKPHRAKVPSHQQHSSGRNLKRQVAAAASSPPSPAEKPYGVDTITPVSMYGALRSPVVFESTAAINTTR